ncbi:hypothetical protein PILCRDRAFT_824264 [Piloderma croceum F 1598]|uniref:HNH nuclease domain-containing protein n=1 Tax=Piloderma croceum (strain F 1598) TaxID=765440 RepID=A0A0C3FFR0_PILCF|nr:hypothetical protein PILCRDRAFT_824264 [Piloderma croceum F 1598]
MSTTIPNQHQGRVTVRDFYGNTVSKFFQYGLVDWERFHSCLRTVIVTSNWAVFEYDENTPGQHGTCCPAGQRLVDPGTYMLLRTDGKPIIVDFTTHAARLRHPTISNTPVKTEHYRTRTCARDPCCLISGLPVAVDEDDFSRFKATHIFPRAHDVDWINKGYSSLITDPAHINEVGGPTKIDSIQNVILLRGDLHNAWVNYKFAVDPDAGYVTIPFVGGYKDIAGKILKLDHIADPNLRPLDELLRDHFRQGVLKNMKGAGEPTWDYEIALGGGRMDLSSNLWDGKEGQAHFEFEMVHRLHSLRVEQEAGS